MMERTQVGILVFDDVEVLDFCGPFEVFSVTRLDEARRREEPSPFEVALAAERLGPVTAHGGPGRPTRPRLAGLPPVGRVGGARRRGPPPRDAQRAAGRLDPRA